MSDVDFRELLRQPTDTAERPRSLPQGHYLATITSNEFDRSKKKQTAFCRWYFKIDGPTDEAGLADACSGIDFTNRQLRKDFYITPKALWRLADALDAVLGKQPGRAYDERIPETRGQRVIIGVVPQLNDDGTDSGFNDVTTVIAA